MKGTRVIRRKAEPCARSFVLAATILVIASHAAIATAEAQGGAIGGTIGKQGRSLSGDQGAKAPPRRNRSERRPDANAVRSLNGVWRWSGQCAKYSEPYVGTVTLAQSGNSFTGTHGNTNMWDRGSISNGLVTGNRVRFDRTFGQYTDHLSLTLSGSGSGMRMSGVIPDTAHSGRCVMTFSKL